MKKIKLVLAATIISIATCFSALAGSWTFTAPEGSANYGNLYTFYLKDDGTYAFSEWVKDIDNTSYWIDYDGTLASSAGIAADGSMYNSKGQYIDFTNGTRKYLATDSASKLKAGMTYDQVVNLLGKDHQHEELYQIEATWYSKNPRSYITIYFQDGVIESYYLRQDFREGQY